jgi:CheY-like chemotaxis protein
MAGEPSRRLLWIDDDAPDRFRYEHRLLTRHGWETTWATSASAGAEALRDQVFEVVLVDQMLPWSEEELRKQSEEVWAGCLLLFWLRGKKRPSKAPPRKAFDNLYRMAPLARNRTVPVILSSAYYDEEIAAALLEIELHLPELPKPIDCNRLLELLGSEARR